MKTHYLKCWPNYMDRIKDGTKRFEIRNNDRDFQTGDHIVLNEWSPETKQYTDPQIHFEFRIDYCLHDHDGLYTGFVIMSISPVSGVGEK